MSTFSGLEVARKALFAQQSALHTTGHNIANANTPGYSRQRVNLQATSPFPTPARNRPEIPGQLGTGVEAGSIQRIRDTFLDIQFRGEHNKLGYWEARANSLNQMENILNETNDTGLSSNLDLFWQSLNDLAGNAEDSGARSVVQERGITLADTFNYVSNSLKAIQKDIGEEMGVTTTHLNSLLTQIKNVNDQIKEVEPHGYLPNDLYDERDRLIDQLSEVVNVKVTYDSSGGNPDASAMGIASIELVDGEGKPYPTPIQLLDDTNTVHNVSVSFGDLNGQRVVNGVTVDGHAALSPTDFVSPGKLKGLIESHGYENTGTADGIYTKMLADIDKMAYAFAEEFNRVHQQGYDLNGEQGEAFFDLEGATAANYIGYASRMSVSDTIQNNPSKIAAASKLNADGTTPKGDGENAQELAKVKNSDLAIFGTNTSVASFFEGTIGNMAVQAQQANSMHASAKTLEGAVESRRQSISGVSLDEEMTNMIKFQHAYNAAARNMTVVDEMLDRIINNMGVVGR
ncbi:flagellar hook-associated protein 1 FlgK [Salirhabdus euzebyi]|uniref:Flagellar hook-associated protein 1 n=1 Tax=Salirhabdus euzebyi TaxID=394506 RepID=A0A841Q588_9BACI|nr:flagellar hook-associated protein FlgK [Salirhabdus euzebyi]MBB6453629.1 flagellar hook-associated protein 1 FlgK [Salirhabdus euzebyi]